MEQQPYVVIMAGGIGSRFWPMSRTQFPKQFHDVLGTGQSLIQLTVQRFQKLTSIERILVVTNEKYHQLTRQQLPELADEQILLEPLPRNTAPCIAWAVYYIAGLSSNAQVVVTPSDHFIADEQAFLKDVQNGLNAAENQESIVTLGITPTRPDTGYGYIQKVEGETEGQTVFKVKTFTEKPDLPLAETFLASGEFLWNSGLFLFNVDVMQRALAQHLPELSELLSAEAWNTLTSSEVAQRLFAAFKPISIDYGVMEKEQSVLVVQSNCGWTDLGTWNSLYDNSQKEFGQNAVQGDVVVYQAEGNMIYSATGRLLVVKDVSDLIVVDTKDVLLVCPRSQEQAIKEIVSDLRSSGREDVL